MVAGKSVRVVPYFYGWAVERGSRQMFVLRAQEEAERVGPEEATRAQAELVVHGRGGRIERKNSYGHDRRNIPG